jgi:hypothetical protein
MISNQIIRQLAEGVERRDMLQESNRLTKKWERTGLLEGFGSPRAKQNMARLLENQAASFVNLLTESSTTADIIGFQNIAFPIVRRVFAGLIANELVSVQPMSLPAGLLFYLDYRFDSVKAGNRDDGFAVGHSLFGSRNSLQDQRAEGGFFNLASSFSQREKVSTATFSGTLAAAALSDVDWDPDLSGNLANIDTLTLTNAYSHLSASGSQYDNAALKQWVPCSGSSTSWSASTDGTPVQIGTLVVYRRHTKKSGNDLVFVVSGSATGVESIKVSYLVDSTLTGGTSGSLVRPNFESDLGDPAVPTMPEIDLRIESVSVNTKTRKMKATWTPEIAQDLAAYQNLDAEVELTQVLSETIALEIDLEILADLLVQATGATLYWSRKPGKFLDAYTGTTESGASFTGNVREWYETLVEVIITAANEIHTKTLRGAANFCVTSPAVCSIFEASLAYKPSYDPSDTKETQFTVGTEKVGSLNSRFTVYKNPYFPKNKILVGFKGSAFLETGYVYAPYVPLIVTPTIYSPDDLTPRKGVMTRYAKKMVRSDFYGTVTIMDMRVI